MRGGAARCRAYFRVAVHSCFAYVNSRGRIIRYHILSYIRTDFNNLRKQVKIFPPYIIFKKRKKFKSQYCANNNDDIAWLIGHHIGDGTIGGVNSRLKNRVRILGDNREVIEKYANVLNTLTGSKSIVKESTSNPHLSKHIDLRLQHNHFRMLG